MGTISFGKAMFKGTIKLLLITLIIIAICFAIGFSLNYFDFYPFYLSDIGVDKNFYAGFFSWFWKFTYYCNNFLIDDNTDSCFCFHYIVIRRIL